MAQEAEQFLLQRKKKNNSKVLMTLFPFLSLENER